MNNENVYLTRKEVEELIKHEKAHGSDGKIIKFDNKHLLKLYHSRVNDLLKQKTVTISENDEDLKVYQKGDYRKHKSFEEMFNYYHQEDDTYIKLRSKSAIQKAIDRQQRVVNTKLPTNAVFIDGVFAGCLILKQKGLQIHSLTGSSMKFKKKVMLQVLKNIKELYDNYIYHIDLDNSPYTKKNYYIDENGEMESVGHSHVLINIFTLKPQIIDLDGKSTIYTDFRSEELELKVLESFNRLMLEFLLGIDLDEYEYNEEDELTYLLRDIGVKAEYIEMFVDHENVTYENIESFIESYEGKGL